MRRLLSIFALVLLASLFFVRAADGQRQSPSQSSLPPIVAPVHLDDPDRPQDQEAAAGSLEEMLKDFAAPIQVLILLSLLTLLPAALLTLTCYTRIIIVLAFVRRAIGAQELPPNPIMVGLALFMTAAIMSPTIGKVNASAITPFRSGELSLLQAAEATADELKQFMARQTREDDLLLALQLSGEERPDDLDGTPFTVMVPAFVLSELRTAFRMGFIVYLPFVLIDLVVASVLLALGMFMLPPTMVAMPLKILLFVLVDGWSLIVQSLTSSFAVT
ncbi:MAG: flagellar type III secretion system pore protein FliP [Planctomycetota bacterium]